MEQKLKGFKIVLGVTGGIAAYKSAYLLRLLTKEGAEVQVIGTENSKEFVGPSTWEALSGKTPLYDTFRTKNPSKIDHIVHAQDVDMIVVAPATANIIGKMANGIADDLLSTILMAATVPVVIAPGMNTAMYENDSYRDNHGKLSSRPGIHFVCAGTGELACGTSGKGRMAEPNEILSTILKILVPESKRKMKWLITGGATREYIDPVRFITNGSSGKTGLAISDAAHLFGGDVTFVGVNVVKPAGIKYRFIPVSSAEDCATTVLDLVPEADIFIMSAAVADFSPQKSLSKIKKSTEDMTIVLRRTKDILKASISLMKKRSVRIGFAAETEELELNAKKKLEDKKLDMIAANLITGNHNPFGSETNTVKLITEKEVEIIEKTHKNIIGTKIVKKAIQLWEEKQ